MDGKGEGEGEVRGRGGGRGEGGGWRVALVTVEMGARGRKCC